MGVNGLFVSLIVGLGLGPVSAALVGAQSIAVREESTVGVRRTLITVSAQQAPLSKVLREIADQANLTVAIPGKVSKGATRVTIDVHAMPLDQVLAKVLDGTGIKATVALGALVFTENAGVEKAPVAQGSITGKVIDAKTRQGLRGAMITIGGTNKETTSNDNGTFRFSDVVPGNYTLHARMLGYVKASQPIVVTEGQTASVEMVLEPSVNALDQVVVTGTVAATELKAVPNAITVITAKQLEERGVTRIDQLFRGDIPGLFVRNSGSDRTLDEVTMFSRGATSFGDPVNGIVATNPIKTYVDGVEIANASYLSQIDPSTIERIEILTGPQASTIYGSNAINGVMQIFTKRGTARRPQLTATLLSGVIQNNFSSGLAPQHDDAVQVAGSEGRLSYMVGGSRNYVGAWTPGKQTTRMSVSGSLRADVAPWTVDLNVRRARTENRAGGSVSQAFIERRETGEWAYSGIFGTNAGPSALTQTTLDGQTLGATVRYTPTGWWSHELALGTDASNLSSTQSTPANASPSDTLLRFSETPMTRMSYRYVSTLHLPVASWGDASVTLGGDRWRTRSSSWSARSQSLTGTLSNPSLTRNAPGKNAGAFAQGQFGIHDALFFTYGLRAEWNPNYGDDAQPNLAPRYGVAYTRDMSGVTVKLRASYGRSTRPPADDKRLSVENTFTPYETIFGRFNTQLTSPELGPEFQQGGEGGVELYFGHRGSLIVTRYNQTVDGLIANPIVDSVASLVPNDANCEVWIGVLQQNGYCYYRQRQYLNVGSVRNQGWELQGMLNTGPFTTRGTYSWTKSRVIGITPRYRANLSGEQYTPGQQFQFLPEHTWALNVTYARSAATLSLNVNGTGLLYLNYSDFIYAVSSAQRLNENRPRINEPSNYRSFGNGYTMADLNGSYRFSSHLEGVLQVNNLGDFYQSDRDARYAVIGRQTKIGVRIR